MIHNGNYVETLYDKEIQDLKFKSKNEKVKIRYDRLRRMIGRETNIPETFKGVDFVTKRITSEHLLQRARYSKTKEYGWIRYVSKEERFHAYIIDEKTINLHRDVTKNGKHKADGKVGSEMLLLKSFFPPPIPTPPKTRKEGNVIIKTRKKGLPEITLSVEEQKRLVKELQKDNWLH